MPPARTSDFLDLTLPPSQWPHLGGHAALKNSVAHSGCSGPPSQGCQSIKVHRPSPDPGSAPVLPASGYSTPADVPWAVAVIRTDETELTDPINTYTDIQYLRSTPNIKRTPVAHVPFQPCSRQTTQCANHRNLNSLHNDYAVGLDLSGLAPRFLTGRCPSRSDGYCKPPGAEAGQPVHHGRQCMPYARDRSVSAWSWTDIWQIADIPAQVLHGWPYRVPYPRNRNYRLASFVYRLPRPCHGNVSFPLVKNLNSVPGRRPNTSFLGGA